ncbi:transposase, partial [Peptostreptococcus porci]
MRDIKLYFQIEIAFLKQIRMPLLCSYINLIPFNTMRLEITNRYKKDIKYWQHWEYDEQYDRFICPNGKNIEFKNYSTRKDKYGYQRDFKIYECESCDDCEFKDRF